MRHIRFSILFLLMAAVLVVGSVHATVYEFQPAQPDLGDLDHRYYYTWGVNWTLPEGTHIESAELTFTNIYDWTREEDILYINILNSVSGPPWVDKGWYQTLTLRGIDWEGGGNNFTGLGDLIGTWTDPNGGPGGKTNLTFEIPAQYFSWLSDGNFGFGFDPDCHYYNDGVKLRVRVPEPGTLILLGCGLLGFVALRRKIVKN